VDDRVMLGPGSHVPGQRHRPVLGMDDDVAVIPNEGVA
jgi:hypothetical protein